MAQTNPNDPAFPILDPNGSYYREGLSIRAELEARAMQGLLTAGWENVGPIASQSVKCADALIAELNKA